MANAAWVAVIVFLTIGAYTMSKPDARGDSPVSHVLPVLPSVEFERRDVPLLTAPVERTLDAPAAVSREAAAQSHDLEPAGEPPAEREIKGPIAVQDAGVSSPKPKAKKKRAQGSRRSNRSGRSRGE